MKAEDSTNTYRTIIQPRKGWRALNLKELWMYRGLFYTFTWRDIKVRYKQTIIGIAWAVLQPVLLMIVFSVFFGGLADIPSDGSPYPIFVFSGLLFWNFFSASVTKASNTLVENENIIKKIYFPRLLLPLSATLTPLVEFLIAFSILIILFFSYSVTPSFWSLLVVPFLIILTFMLASGLGSLLAAINVKYRDVREALPFFIQSFLFITPVIYPTTILPEQYQWILGLNPMTGIIETARALLLQDRSFDATLLLISVCVTLFFFIGGLFYFKKQEKIFADVA